MTFTAPVQPDEEGYEEKLQDWKPQGESSRQPLPGGIRPRQEPNKLDVIGVWSG